MENQPQVNSDSGQLLRKDYSEEEVSLIYELARMSFESGQHKRAEVLARGLINIAPEFIPPYLVLAMTLAFSKNYEEAADIIQTLLKLDQNNLEALILGASIYLCLSNYPMAGTLLGEAGELLKQGIETSPNLKNFYQIQLTRFESR